MHVGAHIRGCLLAFVCQVFKTLPLLSVVPGPSSILEIPSTASLQQAIDCLATKGILAAPVRNVAVPDDAPWHVKYTGACALPGTPAII